RVLVCEAATGKPLLEIPPNPAHRTPATEVAFSADGKLLAVGGYWAKEVRLFDLEKRVLLRSFPNTANKHERWARSWQGTGFAFTPDGRTLVVGGKDGGLHLWDVASGAERLSLAGSMEPALNLALTADGRTAMTSHYGGEIHLWSVAEGQRLRK